MDFSLIASFADVLLGHPVLVVALLVGFYMAWNIGANDVANAMGTSVGSGALTFRQAVIAAAIFEFAGAILVGGSVTDTVRKGIVDTTDFADYLVETNKNTPVTTGVITGATTEPDAPTLPIKPPDQESENNDKVVDNGDGTFTFTPAKDFTGKDLFAIKLDDESKEGKTVTVAVNVKDDATASASQMKLGLGPDALMCGMLAALISAALWLNVATYLGQPVSTTHSIVGGIFGFGLVAGNSVNWATMGKIVASWFISPLVSGLLGFVIFSIVLRLILRAHDPDRAAYRYSPYFVFVIAFILTLSFIYKGLKNIKFFAKMDLDIAMAWAAGCGLVAALVAWAVITRMTRQVVITERQKFSFVERIFAFLQLWTACYVAFAHGANDVANAVGPLAAVFHLQTLGGVSMKVGVPPWILGVGGVGIIIGLAMMGRRVILTVGSKITEMTPSRGFAATFAGATTVLGCSKLGIPVSTTHCLVGAVMGVALARGIAALDVKTARNIFASWIATVPIAAILTVVFYYVLKLVFF